MARLVLCPRKHHWIYQQFSKWSFLPESTLLRWLYQGFGSDQDRSELALLVAQFGGKHNLKSWELWKAHASRHGQCLCSVICHLTDTQRFLQSCCQRHLNHSHANISSLKYCWKQCYFWRKFPETAGATITFPHPSGQTARECESSISRDSDLKKTKKKKADNLDFDVKSPYFKNIDPKQNQNMTID